MLDYRAIPRIQVPQNNPTKNDRIGRSGTVETILSFVDSERGSVCAVYGKPRSGKSATAEMVAGMRSRAAEPAVTARFDGIRDSVSGDPLVDLVGVLGAAAGSGDGEMAQIAASALCGSGFVDPSKQWGMRSAGIGSLTRALRDKLGQSRACVLIDNTDACGASYTAGLVRAAAGVLRAAGVKSVFFADKDGIDGSLVRDTGCSNGGVFDLELWLGGSTDPGMLGVWVKHLLDQEPLVALKDAVRSAGERVGGRKKGDSEWVERMATGWLAYAAGVMSERPGDMERLLCHAASLAEAGRLIQGPGTYGKLSQDDATWTALMLRYNAPELYRRCLVGVNPVQCDPRHHYDVTRALVSDVAAVIGRNCSRMDDIVRSVLVLPIWSWNKTLSVSKKEAASRLSESGLLGDGAMLWEGFAPDAPITLPSLLKL